MKLNVIFASASAALLATTTTTSAFPLLPRSASLDSFFGFSADPQAGFDERTHGKVWVNGVGPGREWAKGYGLGQTKDGREALRGHHQKEESSLWEEIWGMIVGPSQSPSESGQPGHRHGAGFQRVPFGGQRRPHEHDHEHEHHDGPPSHPAWRGKEHEHGGPGRRPHLAPGSATGSGGRVHKGDCLWGRLSRALSHLAPHELILLTTTLLLALFAIMRVALMLVLLVRRYHAYANEVDRPVRGGEGVGYPGAEYRSRRGDGYERVKQVEEEVREKEKE